MEERQLETIKLTETFSHNGPSARFLSEKTYQISPEQIHQQNLIPSLDRAVTIDQDSLINTLNRIHFINGHVLFQFSHIRYPETILLKAFPKSCRDKDAFFRLPKPKTGDIDLEEYQFTHFIIDDGQSMIVVPAVLKEIEKDEVRTQLPEKSYITGQRKAKRYIGNNISVKMIQNGFRANGELMDFNADGFRVKVKPEGSSSFLWFHPNAPSIIHLQNERDMFFAGLCHCIRQKGYSQDREIVLAPINEKGVRFFNKKSRNLRQKLVPSPTIIFEHPAINKRIQLEVHDISFSGFSVTELNQDRTLIPGMIIPNLKICFSGGLGIKCHVQVVYCKKNETHTQSGLSILDMGINEYSALTQILANAKETSVYVSNDADMNALWEFFFDTGFLYPKKYRYLQSNKEILKETYQKLYQNNPEIAKQFVYQKDGKIYGYVSIVRAYERSWMMHHYAARSVNSRRNGFTVLYQMIYYLYDLGHLPSARLDYAMCYFRPENKFPDRVFGGFARKSGNPRICSLDLFAYLSYPALSLGIRLSDGWSLNESSSHDIGRLYRFYGHASGGLLLDALCLEKDVYDGESLEEIYKRHGLVRSWRAYSLTFKGELHAVLIVNQSEFGINFSELLRGIKIIVIKPDHLPWNILSIAVSQLTGIFRSHRVPILIYPFDYVEAKNIPYEKRYQLWILNAQFGSQYMKFAEDKFKVVH